MSWQRFWQRERRDEDLARELESYLTHEEDDKVKAGASQAEARSAALRKLGNATAIREEVYTMNTLKYVDTFWQDVRYGVRQLRRNPAFACSGILIVALGIAATTVIFSVAYGVLLRDLHFDQPDHLVALGSSPRELGFQSAYAGAANYFDWRRQQEVFEDMG